MKAKITYTYHFDPSPNSHGEIETKEKMVKVLTSNIESGINGVWYKQKAENKITDFTFEIKYKKNSFDVIINSPYPINRCEDFLNLIMDDCYDTDQEFSMYYKKHSVDYKPWIEIKSTKDCTHQYQHMQFIAVGNKVQEIKKCKQCEEVFTFDVKKGK